MNILVIGALGHLGVNFIRTQHVHYESIIAIDKDSYCSQSFELIREYVSKFIKADLTKVNLFDIIIWNDIDVILNASGATHVDRSYLRPEEFLHDNIVAVEYLMNVLGKFPQVNLIHMSTDEVYGDDYNSPRDENCMLAPTNPYSASKASGDMIIHSYVKNHHNNVLALRPNNLAGKHQFPDKVIPLFVKKIKEGSTISIHNGGIQRRCFIETELVCDIITRLFYTPYRWPSSNPFVNVGYSDQRGVSVMELVSLIMKEQKKFDSKLEFTKGRQYNDSKYMITNHKLISLLANPSLSKDSLGIITDLNSNSVDCVKSVLSSMAP